MIDYNKYNSTQPRSIIAHRTVFKETTLKKKKLTKINKDFLKLIGLKLK